MELRLSAYGQNNIEKGIISILMDENEQLTKSVIELDGKSNMVIECDELLICSVQTDSENYLLFINKMSDEKTKVKSDYFYSYGDLVGDHLLLASFSEGLDSVYNLKTKTWKHKIHERKYIQKIGRSHYIKCIDDKIISIDNALQQIYIYEDFNLKNFKVIDFDLDTNLRLASFDEESNVMFINTELSNEVLVFDLKTLKVIDKVKMVESTSFFSGGNAYHSELNLLCISMRGEDEIYIYTFKDELRFIKKIKTQKMPRDLKIIENILYITCYEDDCIQCIDLTSLSTLGTIDVYKPVTFSM